MTLNDVAVTEGRSVLTISDEGVHIVREHVSRIRIAYSRRHCDRCCEMHSVSLAPVCHAVKGKSTLSADSLVVVVGL